MEEDKTEGEKGRERRKGGMLEEGRGKEEGEE